MVYYPIHGGRQVSSGPLTFAEARARLMKQDQYLQSVVSAVKDVEGLNHQFLFNLYHKYVPSSTEYLEVLWASLVLWFSDFSSFGSTVRWFGH